MVNSPIELGTLGMSDTLILMVLALVVFGPRRLPQIGRQIGKLMYEFRKASNDFKFQMEEELRTAEEADRRKREEAERARNLALNPPAQTIESQTIAAEESVSAPAHPLYGSDYPEAYPPETAAPVVEEPPATMPRIQPPSTGAPVPARQGTGITEQGTEEQGTWDQATPASTNRSQGTPAGTEGSIALPLEDAIVAEANIGAETAAPVTETAAQTEGETHSNSNPAETVTQHG